MIINHQINKTLVNYFNEKRETQTEVSHCVRKHFSGSRIVVDNLVTKTKI